MEPADTSAGNKDYALFADKALEQIRAALKGNGARPEAVTLVSFTPHTVAFKGVTRIELKGKTAVDRQTGKAANIEEVKDAQDARAIIERALEELSGNKEIADKIKAVIAGREDRGFGLSGETVKLPFLDKKLVYYEGCKACGTQGNIRCSRCNGLKSETCPKCNGQGAEFCTFCRGNKQVSDNAGTRTCPQCSGSGRLPCRTCNQTRKISCPGCGGHGSMKCMKCAATGWFSHIVSLEIEGLTSGEVDISAVPDTVQQHAGSRADLLKLSSVLLREDLEEQGDLAIGYDASLPYAEAEFAIKDRPFPFLVIGRDGQIFNMPCFLDKTTGKALAILRGAGKAPVIPALKDASRYRLVRHAIIDGISLSPPKAVKSLLRRFPLGLSGQYAEELIEAANKAVGLITQKPKQYGLFNGLLIAGAFYIIYYLTGSRDMLIGLANVPLLGIFLDLVIFGLGYGIASAAIKSAEKTALKKALKGILPPKLNGRIRPRTDNSALAAAIGCLLMFGLALAGAVYNQTPPEWLAGFLPG